MRVLGAAAIAAVVVAFVGVPTVAAAPSMAPERVSDFQLTDTTRMAHRLSYFQYAPAIVLMSQKVGSPRSRAGAAELARLQAAYRDKGVLFYMINSADTREDAAAEAKAQRFTVPVLMDDLQLVGEQMRIQRDGEVFVLDPKAGNKIAYHGPGARSAAAIDAVLAGRYPRRAWP